MSTLKDELLKARIVSKKQVRQAEHQERQKRMELGRQGVEQEKARRLAEQQEKERLRREEQQRQERLRREEEQARGGLQRIRTLVAGNDLCRHGSGPHPFHYLAADGALPRVGVSGAMAERLEAGRAAIVELPGPPAAEVYIVPPDVAEQVRRIDPSVVRFWNRDG